MSTQADRVVVVDDTFRESLGRDPKGRMVQDVVRREIVFEGAALRHAILRAKRWMRSRKFRTQRPPRHIDLMMVAFHNHDKDGFTAAMKGA